MFSGVCVFRCVIFSNRKRGSTDRPKTFPTVLISARFKMIDTYPAIICCLRVPLGDTIKRLLLVGRRSKHHPGLPPLRLGFDSWLVRGLRLVDLNLIPSVSSTQINFHAQVGVVERINHDPLTPETISTILT